MTSANTAVQSSNVLPCKPHGHATTYTATLHMNMATLHMTMNMTMTVMTSEASAPCHMNFKPCQGTSCRDDKQPQALMHHPQASSCKTAGEAQQDNKQAHSHAQGGCGQYCTAERSRRQSNTCSHAPIPPGIQIRPDLQRSQSTTAP